MLCGEERAEGTMVASVGGGGVRGDGSAFVKVEQGASHSTHRGQPKKSMQTKHRSSFWNIIVMCYSSYYSVLL